jgi:hypothetical protein
MRTLLLVDLGLGVQVEANNDHVANNVEHTASIQDIGVLEGDLLGHLHHPKDDDDVGTVAWKSCQFDVHATGKIETSCRISGADLHLGTEAGHCDGVYCDGVVVEGQLSRIRDKWQRDAVDVALYYTVEIATGNQMENDRSRWQILL